MCCFCGCVLAYDRHHRVTLSEAFCLFTDNFILPFAFRADADLFRTQIDEPKIRRLLVKFADELKELYARYAAPEDPKKKRKRPRMTAFTFSQCLVDKGIQDASFSSDKVLALLNKVVRTKRESDAESTAAPTSASGGGGGGALLPAGLSVASIGATEDDDVAFSEFEEAMIAIACHKFPDPYVSLESRVEKFFSFYLRGMRGEHPIAVK